MKHNYFIHLNIFIHIPNHLLSLHEIIYQYYQYFLYY